MAFQSKVTSTDGHILNTITIFACNVSHSRLFIYFLDLGLKDTNTTNTSQPLVGSRCREQTGKTQRWTGGSNDIHTGEGDQADQKSVRDITGLGGAMLVSLSKVCEVFMSLDETGDNKGTASGKSIMT